MRALLSKVLTGSMVAGAALLVAACGGEGDTNITSTNIDAGTEALDTGNDVTAIDAGDMNAMDAGNTADMNAMDAGNTANAM